MIPDLETHTSSAHKHLQISIRDHPILPSHNNNIEDVLTEHMQFCNIFIDKPALRRGIVHRPPSFEAFFEIRVVHVVDLALRRLPSIRDALNDVESPTNLDVSRS